MRDLPDAVLFACTRNSVRSPMAEGLLKHLLGHRIYVDSVGVRVGEIDPFVIEVMEELGIDISKHRGKDFGRRPAWLAVLRTATPRAPGRKPWEAVSMDHY